MALLTWHIRMLSRQWEITFVVVEIHVIPTCRVMTGRAISAKIAAMFIVLLMAGVTIEWRTFVNTILMTRFAIHFRMVPFQFERS